MKLKICHLYPDVLNLYGDGGNIICIQQRLKWRGIESEVQRSRIGDTLSLSDCDFLFIGGGQDFEQEVLLPDLQSGKDREILDAIHDGITILAICGGYQMLGQYYETYDGVRCDFIGAMNLYTVGSKQRMIGNTVYRCTETAVAVLWSVLKITAERPGLDPAWSHWLTYRSVTATMVRMEPKGQDISMSSGVTVMDPFFRKIPPFATRSSVPL